MNKYPYLFFAVISTFYGCSGNGATTAPPPEIPVYEVTSKAVTTYQEYPASVEGTVNVEIRPQVDGTLDQVFVDEGSLVKKGDPLFKINDQPYKERLNNALAAKQAAEGALANAMLEVEKLSPLVENKVVSDYQLKAAKAAYQIAAGNVEQSKAAVSSAKISLGYTLIKAPVDGYIGRLLKKQGSLVGPTDAQSLTQLSDVHEVHVYFSLSETDFTDFKAQYEGNRLADKIKNVPPVTLILSDAQQYTSSGRIDMIDGQFDKSTGAITVRATFPNGQGLLRAGNTGKIKLGVHHNSLIQIPVSATMEMQDRIFVFEVDNRNKVNKQAITIEGKQDLSYLVRRGLKPGAKIVFSGLDRLQEGQLIKPKHTNIDSPIQTASN